MQYSYPQAEMKKMYGWFNTIRNDENSQFHKMPLSHSNCFIVISLICFSLPRSDQNPHQLNYILDWITSNRWYERSIYKSIFVSSINFARHKFESRSKGVLKNEKMCQAIVAINFDVLFSTLEQSSWQSWSWFPPRVATPFTFAFLIYAW